MCLIASKSVLRPAKPRRNCWHWPQKKGYELTDEELNAINGGILYADCTWDDCNDATCKLCKGLCDNLYRK